MNELLPLLIKTKALNVCDEDKMFWYTSGKLGPYYINTENLYGNKNVAEELLSFIDLIKEKPFECPYYILNSLIDNYDKNYIYQEVIDYIYKYINTKFAIDNIKYISGGERRDWFFSLIIAYILNKKHITIYNNNPPVITNYNGTNPKKLKKFPSREVLHITDLITVASSFEKKWIPILKNYRTDIKWVLTITDRMQGGRMVLAKQKIATHSLININKHLFDNALALNLINQKQYQLIIGYLENPIKTTNTFIDEHPDFIFKSLNSKDIKIRERANLCLTKNYYSSVNHILTKKRGI